MAHVGERPTRLDAHVDVHATPAGGLREAHVAEVAEQHAGLGGDADGVVEVGARLRVEVDAQLVGMVDVLAAHGPRVEGDGPHLPGPADDGDLRRADLVGVAARRELDARRLDVLRGAARDALLEERVAAALLARGDDDALVPALGPPLEGGRPAVQRAHDPVADREVVLDDVELGDRRRAVGGREDHAVGARDPQITAPGLDDHRFGRAHEAKFYAIGYGAFATQRPREVVGWADGAAGPLLHRVGRPAAGLRDARPRPPARPRRHLADAPGLRLAEPGVAPLARRARRRPHVRALRRARVRALGPRARRALARDVGGRPRERRRRHGRAALRAAGDLRRCRGGARLR